MVKGDTLIMTSSIKVIFLDAFICLSVGLPVFVITLKLINAS